MDKRGPLISIFMISIIFIISIIYNRIQSTSLEKIHDHILINENFEYKQYSPSSTDMAINQANYHLILTLYLKIKMEFGAPMMIQILNICINILCIKIKQISYLVIK